MTARPMFHPAQDIYSVAGGSSLARLMGEMARSNAHMMFVHSDRVRVKAADDSYSLLDLDPVPPLADLLAAFLPEAEMMLLALSGRELETLATVVIDGVDECFRVTTFAPTSVANEWFLGMSWSSRRR